MGRATIFYATNTNPWNLLAQKPNPTLPIVVPTYPPVDLSSNQVEEHHDQH